VSRSTAAVLAALTAATVAGSAPAGAEPTAPSHRPPQAEAAAHGWAISTLRRMSLEEKVGQLFVTYAYGSTADTAHPQNREEFGLDTPAEIVQRYHLGGVIYFAWTDSFHNPRQVAELSNGLQRAALSSGAHVPLLISTDQEHGVVARFGPPATQFPGNMALGAGRSVQDAELAAAIGGAELRAVGINQNYAPVADVNVNAANPVIGVRSFSSDPQLAADMVAAQVRGYQNGYDRRLGVAATVKHFPGHGDTDVDSHTGLPVITHDREQWEQLDAPPFRAAIAQGVDMVMTAHIVVPELDDSGEPATLSRNVLTGMLREELGFDGVVVTDSLQMDGVRQMHSDAEIPVLALKAGADQLLMPWRLDVAYNAVLDAVRSGELTERRIDESVYRILKLKYKRGIVHQPLVDPAAVDATVGVPRHQEAAQRVTDRTVTALTNDELLPLHDRPGTVLVTGWGATTTATLAQRIAARGPQTTVVETGLTPDEQRIAQAVAAAEQSDLVVVLTNRAWSDAQQQELVRKLAATGKPVVGVAVRDPYDAAYLPEARAWLATYSYTAVSMESLSRVLFGEVSPAGRLPVNIPSPTDPGTDRFPFGHGLTW